MRATVAIVFFLFAFVSCSFGQSVEIEKVINELKRALLSAREEIGNQGNMPNLKSAEITLETVAKVEGGAKIKLWIISLGTTYSKEKTQTISITLVPTKEGQDVGDKKGFAEQLKTLIVETSKGIASAGSGDMPLKAKELSVELKFVVTKGASGGASFEIIPVTAELSGDLSKSSTHQIKVTFSNETD